MLKITFLLLIITLLPAFARAQDKLIRVGVIGLDTSHAPAFAKVLNDPANTGDLAGLKIVAAFPAGSPDLKSSSERVASYTEDYRKMGIEIVDSIPALLTKVDAVLLESVDGRPHLEQARPVILAGKPLFIDKPLAGSLADSIAIAQLAAKHKVPWFSSSSLRFGAGIASMRIKNDKIGDVLGCDAWSPCPIESTHPDLYWYGIHGVETLFTIMGPGCESVTRVKSDGTDLVIGVWKGGRIGTFRGIRAGKADYGAMVYGSKAIAPSGGFDGYKPLVVEIAKFFKTGKAPVEPAETIEIMAFMEAADESKRHDGAKVTLADVIKNARAEAEAKVEKSPAQRR